MADKLRLYNRSLAWKFIENGMSDSGSADNSYSRQLQEWPYDWAVTERTLNPDY